MYTYRNSGIKKAAFRLHINVSFDSLGNIARDRFEGWVEEEARRVKFGGWVWEEKRLPGSFVV